MTDLSQFFDHSGDAWIDLPTNFTSLPGFDSPKDIQALLDHDIPRDLSSTFMHEMTHHWCFDSPLGLALSLVKSRITYGITALELGIEYEELDVLDDIIRYQTTIELMRPIAEGLALFAEHDARPSGLAIYSTPMLQMFLMRKSLFLPGEEDAGPHLWTPDKLTKLHRKGLDEVRLSKAGIERKANLLCSSLDTATSPYLSGYLTIKSLWHMQMEATETIISSDMMLSYLRTYFYYDHGLIAALLDPGHETQIADRLAKYIHARLTTLSNNNLKKDLELWDEAADSEGNQHLLKMSDRGDVESLVEYQPTPGLRNDEEQSQRGFEHLVAMINALDHQLEPHELLRAIKHVAAKRLALRGLMPVAAVPVQATSRDTVTALDGTTFGPFENKIDDDLPLSGDYVLEYFHIPSNRRAKTVQFVVLTRGDEISATLKIAEDDVAIHEMLPHLRPSAQMLEEIRNLREFEQNVRDSKRMLITREILNDYAIEETCKKNARIWYRGLASRFLKGSNWEAVLDKHGEFGLFDLFDRDVSRMRHFAEYSLRANTAERTSTMSQMFDNPDELNSFHASLDKIETDWQATLHFRTSEAVSCFM